MSHQRLIRPALQSRSSAIVALTAVMLGIGLLLTHALTGTVGRVGSARERALRSSSYERREPDHEGGDVLVNTLPAIASRRWSTGFSRCVGGGERRRSLPSRSIVGGHRLSLRDLRRRSAASGGAAPQRDAVDGEFSVGSHGGRDCLVRRHRLDRGVLHAQHRGADRRARSWGPRLQLPSAFARVYRGLHYPSDVFAGAFLGLPACGRRAGRASCSLERGRRGAAATAVDRRTPGARGSEEPLDRRDRASARALHDRPVLPPARLVCGCCESRSSSNWSSRVSTSCGSIADDVDLLVERGRARVQVRRADVGDDSVDRHDLRVQHRRLERPDPGAGVEQRRVCRFAGKLDETLVGVRAREQEIDFDAALRRVGESVEDLFVRARSTRSRCGCALRQLARACGTR